jgi:predicted dehydrogenase
MSWRYKGGPGTGALGDIGSHLVDVGEFLCGPVESVQGAVLTTTVPKRALPAGAVVGHAAAALSDTWEPVENEDLASFAVRFANGASGTISVSRVAVGHPNALAFEVFGTEASASFDMSRAAEFGFADHTSPSVVNGYRQVLVGPEHPYIAGGLAMDFPGVGHGQQDFFTYQSRAFLEQIAGLGRLPACPPLSHGLHNLQLLQAVVSSAEGDGRAVPIT